MQYPKKIQIGFQEGTCPLRCKKCHGFGEYAKEIKKPQKMSLENAKRLIDEIAQMEAVPTIQPHIVTEPFANKDLKEIILYCRNKEIPLSIITNGILLDQEWMDFLIQNLNRNSTVSFSLDAVTQETYEKVRGAYSLMELEEKVDYLMNERKGRGPRVSVNYVYERDNYEETEVFLNKWKYKVDAVHIGVALDAQRKVPDEYRKGTVIKENTVCPFLQEVMAIDAGGEVRACAVDGFGNTCLGNALEEGIMQVWNSKKRQAFLQKHKQNILSKDDFCYGCEWGHSLYNFDRTEKTEEFIIKIADYAVYYNRKLS